MLSLDDKSQQKSSLARTRVIIFFENGFISGGAWYMFCDVVLIVLSSLAIVLLRKRESVLLSHLHSYCPESVEVLWFSSDL